MRVISRRTDGNGFGGSAVEVAEIVGDFFEFVGVEFLTLPDFVVDDGVVRWLRLLFFDRFS